MTNHLKYFWPYYAMTMVVGVLMAYACQVTNAQELRPDRDAAGWVTMTIQPDVTGDRSIEPKSSGCQVEALPDFLTEDQSDVMLPAPCDPSKAHTYNENRCGKCCYDWVPIYELGNPVPIGHECQPRFCNPMPCPCP